MPARTHIIRTRPGLLFRVWRRLQIIRLNILIDSNINWLMVCAKDGILESETIRAVERQTEELTAELLQWEQA